MTDNYLDYQLVAGYIHNWLLAGPLAISIPNPGRDEGNLDERKLEIAQQFYRPEVEFSDKPVERTNFKVDGVELSWRYVRASDDHLLNVSSNVPTWNRVRYWAYTRLQAPAEQTVNLVLTALGAVDVWLNGKHVCHQAVFAGQKPQSARFQAFLEHGDNLFMVRMEQVAAGETAFALALKVDGLPEDVAKDFKVLVPTCARFPHRYQMFERAFDFAYLEEVVNYRGAHFNLRWADDIDVTCHYAYQTQDADENIYVEGSWDTDPNEPLDIGHTIRLFERPYFVTLKATGKEYFEQGMRYERRMPLYVIDTAYSTAAYDSMAGRRREALEDAAKYNKNLFAEIAKIELKRWEGVDHSSVRWYPFDSKYVEEVIVRVNQREVGSEVQLAGLLPMMYRYTSDPSFPEKLKQPLEDCILNFRYWQDESNEKNAILFHTIEILAGQLYPRRKFTNSGKTGHWHQQNGEKLALDWLRQRGANGFEDWNSPESFELFILALTHLTSLAKNETVQELSAVLLDKLFLSMAINSYKGAFGAARGRANASMLKSAQFEATSGASRLLWGLGVFNAHLIGTVSLATSDYEFPVMIGEIAADLPKEMLSKECSIIDPLTGEKVNTITYKTPDYMLSSVQDYRPGQPGACEHVWQATLGSEAVVFGNHPACLSEDEAFRPGFWRGNRVLPRVAQWKNVLITIHKLPDDDWMGFTHAYFPVYAFDEHEFRGNWAFARKGDGYLALTASHELKMNKHQPDGYREIRTYGTQNVWLCCMGRAELDGTFDKFKRKMLRMKVDWQGLAAKIMTPRRDEISFGWEGPLVVNGQEQPLAGFKHFDNPYCTAGLPVSQMEVSFNGTVMRLNFD